MVNVETMRSRIVRERERAIENGDASPDESWQTEIELTCTLDVEKFRVLDDPRSARQFTKS